MSSASSSGVNSRDSWKGREGGVVPGGVSAVLLVAFWNVIWPYLVGAHVLGGRWWLWRTDRFIRAVIGSGTVQGGRSDLHGQEPLAPGPATRTVSGACTGRGAIQPLQRPLTRSNFLYAVHVP